MLEINFAFNTAAWLDLLNVSLGCPLEMADFCFKWFKRHIQISYVVIKIVIFRLGAKIADVAFKRWAVC